MHRSALLTAVLSALLVPAVACTAPAPGGGRRAASAPGAPERPLPDLEDAVRAWETREQRPLALSELLDRLAEADVVFLGETHLDDTTHRVEAAVLEGLLARRAGQVVLSLEMFERDAQPALDRYLAGSLDEAAFLAAARPWSNYRTDYRPLIESARRAGIPVVAANAPAALRRKVSSGGRAALEALASEERSLLPREILPADAAYWERVDRATRGHMGFASQTDDQRLWAGQNLWDNSMGEACADALRAHPGCTVLHVVGGFHVMYRDGTAAQLRARAPAARVAVVEVQPTPLLAAARPERDAARADYVVYAAELGRSLSDGTHAVSVPAELRYTIDVPPGATAERPAPLLVWLPDADERPADLRALLVAALGDQAAIAVVEPPYPESARDLAPGGRWAASSDFRADQARVQHGLERLVEYVTRRLPVSGERLVVAGRGLGATAALWSATYGEWLAATVVAVAPRGATALRLEGLPDDAPATRAVRLVVAPGAESDLSWLAEDLRGIGVPAELAALDVDGILSRPVEGLLRDALGLAPRAPEGAAPTLVVLERDLPRARQWAEVHARALERAGRPAQVVLAGALRGDEDPARVERLSIGGAWPIASFAEGRGLPLAPGDFGGTTVLVVPASAGETERAAWLELEQAKALKKRSPFAGLRVAFEQGTPGPAQVLAELRDSGAHSVLVVPAVFCASPAEMRDLQSALGDAGDELDLAWLPGLGAELVLTPED